MPPLPPDLKQVLDPNWWRALLPGFAVSETPSPPPPPLALGDALLEELRQRLEEEGYFDFTPADWAVDFARLATGVATLRGLGHPAAFCFLYDDYWPLITRVSPVVAAFLGEPATRLPDIWAWHLDPAAQDQGWEAHRDKGRQTLRPDGSPKTLTLWLPLAPATPLNGCMYLLPKNRDPHYNTPQEFKPNVPLGEVRALPAQPGQVFFWDQALLHWSGRASRRADGPRVSVSCEYQRADEPPFKAPLARADFIPGFEERLHLVGRLLLQYRHMQPLTPQLETLVALLAGVGG